jgi:endonuclease-3 related protein
MTAAPAYAVTDREMMTPTQVFDILLTALGPQHWWPAETPFEVAVGAVLTQNTAWANVEKAITTLRKAGALTPSALLALPESELAQLIRPAGYHNVKARYLRTMTSWVADRAGGDISRLASESPAALRDELLALHGVGKETADSILLYAVGLPVFVIDAYTLRIGARLHLLPEHADYDTAQRMFTTQLPASLSTYQEYHALVVRVAKEHCRTRPICDGCPLASCCPSARRVVRQEHRARRMPAREAST